MIQHPIPFAHGIHLRGYQIFDDQGHTQLTPLKPDDAFLLTTHPNEAFTLSLYWRSTTPITTPYTVFTHLIAADGFNRVGQDNQPVWGTYPTTAWLPNETIVDKYTLTLPAGTPPGDHHLHIGWYQSKTGKRIPIIDETGQPEADDVILNMVVRVEDSQD